MYKYIINQIYYICCRHTLYKLTVYKNANNIFPQHMHTLYTHANAHTLYAYICSKNMYNIYNLSSVYLCTHNMYAPSMYKNTLNTYTIHVYMFFLHAPPPQRLSPIHTLYVCTYMTIFTAPCHPAEPCWGQDGAAWAGVTVTPVPKHSQS